MRSGDVSELSRRLILALSIFVAVSAAAAADPTKTYKAPPKPTGSAQVVVTPGMSKDDWEKAYKETGRPPFKQSSVKRNGGNVERD
jgi:hypothetical protein